MFRKIAGSLVVLLLTSTSTAIAADQILPTAAVGEKVAVETRAVVSPSAFFAPKILTRGSVLPALYVGLAALNGYDAYTTTKGVAQGARESNGVLRGAAGSPAAIWAIKGGVTAGAILVSERLWRSGHRVQAVGMMVAANSVMAVVGVHNNSALRNQR